MNAKKHRMNVLTLVALGIVFLIGAPGAQAAMVNWTETVYTVSSGELTFDWDKNSQYDLSFSGPSVQDTPIFIPPFNLFGTLYEFVIPNFYDPLPKKTVEITINGANSGAGGMELPRVLDVFGADSSFTEPGPALPAPGEFVHGTITSQTITELWHIFPNPDFETVTIWAPVEFELEGIKIVTQSVPISGAAWLLGSGLFGLIFLRRKIR